MHLHLVVVDGVPVGDAQHGESGDFLVEPGSVSPDGQWQQAAVAAHLVVLDEIEDLIEDCADDVRDLKMRLDPETDDDVLFAEAQSRLWQVLAEAVRNSLERLS